MFFAFHIAITASAIETSSSAKRRALSTSGTGCASASASAARFHIVATVSPPGAPAQNRAVATSCGVAVAASPMLFTSLKSVAYCALVNAGAGGGRNCDGDVIAHGVIVANC